MTTTELKNLWFSMTSIMIQGKDEECRDELIESAKSMIPYSESIKALFNDTWTTNEVLGMYAGFHPNSLEYSEEVENCKEFRKAKAKAILMSGKEYIIEKE